MRDPTVKRNPLFAPRCRSLYHVSLVFYKAHILTPNLMCVGLSVCVSEDTDDAVGTLLDGYNGESRGSFSTRYTSGTSSAWPMTVIPLFRTAATDCWKKG